jgi:hypothetical protein
MDADIKDHFSREMKSRHSPARRARHSNIIPVGIARTKGVSDESGHRKDNAFYDVHAVPIAGCSKRKEIVIINDHEQQKGDQNCSNAPCLNKAD